MSNIYFSFEQFDDKGNDFTELGSTLSGEIL